MHSKSLQILFLPNKRDKDIELYRKTRKTLQIMWYIFFFLYDDNSSKINKIRLLLDNGSMTPTVQYKNNKISAIMICVLADILRRIRDNMTWGTCGKTNVIQYIDHEGFGIYYLLLFSSGYLDNDKTILHRWNTYTSYVPNVQKRSFTGRINNQKKMSKHQNPN